MKYYIKLILYLYVLIQYSVSFSGSYDDFFRALIRDDAVLVSNLLKRGFDPNTPGPDGQAGLLHALRQPSFKVIDELLAWPNLKVEVRTAADESALMLAAMKGYGSVCKKLIDRDADVNKPGWTPLHYAATGGHADIVLMLLEHHAYIDAASPNGTTPLMMAAMYGSARIVKILLEAGADPVLKNDANLTALHFATLAERSDSAEIIGTFVRALSPK